METSLENTLGKRAIDQIEGSGESQCDEDKENRPVDTEPDFLMLNIKRSKAEEKRIVMQNRKIRSYLESHKGSFSVVTAFINIMFAVKDENTEHIPNYETCNSVYKLILDLELNINDYKPKLMNFIGSVNEPGILVDSDDDTVDDV